mmetsp:Transcript_117073/g.342927  ORF Transcript_117073/g.342927 Transcript_117073/m.342927 type:complete len:245 (-) Transcript_117073:405-1139(-)
MVMNTPTKRESSPTPMTGRTPLICGRMLRSVPLPIMLNRISCPNTQTPPKMPSTSRRTSRSATMAKEVPMATTRGSDWKSEPGAMPMGTKTWLRWLLAPRLKAIRATARVIRKDSTGTPVKKGCPLKRSCILREISQPLTEPRSTPMPTVATMRRTFAKKSVLTNLEATNVWSGDTRPNRKPKNISAMDPSSGAHVKTSRGIGCRLKRAPNSFIFGITKPGPRAERTVPSTKPSRLVKPRLKIP